MAASTMAAWVCSPSGRRRGSFIAPSRTPSNTAFVDSIDEPVVLLGTSHGGMLALGAAARSSAVTAAVAYEPPAPEALSEEEAQRFEEPTEAMARAVTEGRMTAAMRSFAEFVVNDDETAAFHAVDYVETTAKYAPILLEELQLEAQPGAFSPTNPALLAQITAPVLLLHGTRTPLRWFTDAVHHVADHVADAEVRELTGAGHAGPILQAEAIADEVIRFLASTPTTHASHVAAAST